jgi:hypothetical protein
MLDPADAPDPGPFPDPQDDEFWARYLESCRISGGTPVSRERAAGPIQEWNEVLAGRPEPTTH